METLQLESAKKKMKTILCTIKVSALGLALITSVFGNQSCYLVDENGHDLIREGNCKTRHSPCSTFKPTLAAMGFDRGILADTETPKIDFDPEKHNSWLETWRQAQTPKTWMQFSCLWYSLYVVDQLNRDTVQDYLKRFDYGNQSMIWSKEAPWIMGSLKLSAEEQIRFFQRLNAGEFNLNSGVIENVREIMFVQELADGWKLYGKTGYGNQRDKQGRILEKGQGWFVGWISNETRIVYFAKFIQDDVKTEPFTSLRAKDYVINSIVNQVKQSEYKHA